MFEAYVDESGTDEAICAVAGFLGLTAKWRAFEADWQRALDAAGVDHFHSKEFFGGYPPFAVLQPPTRRKLIETLVALITDRSTGLHLVAAAVDVQSFFARTEHERTYLTGGRWSIAQNKWVFSGAPTRPYYLPLCNVLDQCNRTTEKVDIFHDQHQVYAKHVLRLHNEMKKHRKPAALRAGIGDLVFASKRERLPLQAADLAAYLTFCRVAYGQQADSDSEIGIASRGFGAFGQRVIRFYDATSIEATLTASLPQVIREGRAASQLRSARNKERGKARQRDQQASRRKT